MCMCLTTDCQNTWDKKMIEPQKETNEVTIIIEDFTIPLSVMDGSSEWKIRKNTVGLNRAKESQSHSLFLEINFWAQTSGVMSRPHKRKCTSGPEWDPGIHTFKDVLVTPFYKKKGNVISVVPSLLLQSNSFG